MRLRAGYTLIEMLVTIAIGSVVLGLAVGLVGAAMRHGRVGTDHVHRCGVLARLAERFRADVHAANTAEPSAASADDVLRLSMPAGRTVEYRGNGRELTRVERVAEQVRHRDSFLLPAQSEVAVTTDSLDNLRLVSLVIVSKGEFGTPKPENDVAARLVLRVDAVVAMDHRFATAEDPAGEEEEHHE